MPGKYKPKRPFFVSDEVDGVDYASSSSDSSDPDEVNDRPRQVRHPNLSEPISEPLDHLCPNIAKPTLPIGAGNVMRFMGRPPTKTIAHLPFSASEARDFVRMAPTLGRSDTPLYYNGAHQHHCRTLEACIMAIDPDAGDSILHAVVNAGNMDGLYGIYETFDRDIEAAFYRERAAHVLMMHQNHEGNTALHSAVRTGQLRMVKAVLRMFYFFDMHEGLSSSGRSCAGEGHAVDDITLTIHLVRPALFVDTRNNAGYNAASEARQLNFNAAAESLEGFLSRLDPRVRRLDGDFKRQMEELLQQNYCFS